VSPRRTELEARLDALRNILGSQAVEDALAFMPTAEVEELALRDERERAETDRTATELTRRETRDALLAGKFGATAKAAAASKVAELGPNAAETLIFCAKLAADARKQEYYRRLNGSKKDSI
jgi:hypothetical protein